MGRRRVGLCLCAIDGIGVDRGEGRAICTFFGVRNLIFDGKGAIALRMEHHEKEGIDEDDGEIDKSESERMVGVTSSSSNSGDGSDGTPSKMKRSASFADFSDVSKRTFQIVTEPRAFLVFLCFYSWR